jgi:hypothetical protein
MRVLLDIKENKALFFLELLNNFSFVKYQPVAADFLLPEMKEEAKVVENVNNKVKEEPLLAQCFGMWEGRDIDLKKIRKERRERRTKYYDNAAL